MITILIYIESIHLYLIHLSTNHHGYHLILYHYLKLFHHLLFQRSSPTTPNLSSLIILIRAPLLLINSLITSPTSIRLTIIPSMIRFLKVFIFNYFNSNPERV
jgi:hypothetical protein